MRPAENIERLIKNLSDKTSAKMDERVRENMLHALAETEKPSAQMWPNIGRTIMKIAAALVIIALVVLGLFELTGSENTSGVVWADVAGKVQASQGLICRQRTTSPIPRFVSICG
jgi:hypothetical protein